MRGPWPTAGGGGGGVLRQKEKEAVFMNRMSNQRNTRAYLIALEENEIVHMDTNTNLPPFFFVISTKIERD